MLAMSGSTLLLSEIQLVTSYQEPGSTSLSLLKRAQKLDGEAWKRLCDLYGPMVYRRCRNARLQEQDARDVVQEVFRAVFLKLNTFRWDADGSTFRGWLSTITKNQVALFFRKQQGAPTAFGGSDAQAQFANQPFQMEENAFDMTNDRSELLQRGLDLIRGDFSAETWAAFEMFAIHELPAREVAERLGISENAVRQMKYRVVCRLADELEGQI